MWSYLRKAIQGLENLPGYSYFQLQRFCFSHFLLQLQRYTAAVMLEYVLLEQYAPVKQQQQQAYECCSSRVFECHWVLLLLLLRLLLLLLSDRDCLANVLVFVSCSLRLNNQVIVVPCPFYRGAIGHA